MPWRRIAATPPIAIICALAIELDHLRGALPDPREEWHAGRRVWLSHFAGHPVVLSECGMGMLSAAAATEAVLGRYAPAAVLNYGCAGAHRRDLLPGDIVIGERVVAYDSQREAPDGTTRFAPVTYLFRGETRRADALAAAPHLLAAACDVAAASADSHEPWPVATGWPVGVPHRAPRSIVGTVASADRWNRAPATIESIAARHGSACEDMEAAAIALTCASHDVPFLTIKDISNNELLRTTASGTAMLTEVGKEQLGRRAGTFVYAFLARLVAAPPGTG